MEPAGFGDDFGQKIDLCVRIREIIRAYPEGTAVLKELVSFRVIIFNALECGTLYRGQVLDQVGSEYLYPDAFSSCIN